MAVRPIDVLVVLLRFYMTSHSVLSLYRNVEETSQELPEKRLLLAILRRALLDYLCEGSRIARSAQLWFFGDSNHRQQEFSFSWVCQQLDFDRERFLQEVRAMSENESHPRLQYLRVRSS